MPRSGLHVPLDVNFQDDAKVLRVSLEAELVYIRSLALAKRLDEEGALDHAHLYRLSEKMDDDRDVLAKELVDVGLWIETPGGWYIAAWAAYNQLSEEREQARAAEAERKRKWRESKKLSQGAVPSDTETMSHVAPTSEVKRSTSEVKQQQQPAQRLASDERKWLLHATATVIAQRQGKNTEAETKRNPQGWLAAAITGIESEIAERCHVLMTEHPDWLAEEIAEAFEPQKRGPLCGVCMTENPTYCGEDCPLPPPLGETVDNVTSIRGIQRQKPKAPIHGETA